MFTWSHPHSLTVEPPGVVLLRPDGGSPTHGPKQSGVCAHEVDMDASVKVPVCPGGSDMMVKDGTFQEKKLCRTSGTSY